MSGDRRQETDDPVLRTDPRQRTLDDMTSRGRRVVGLGLVAAGAAIAAGVMSERVQLNAPPWIALAAGAVATACGAYVLLHGRWPRAARWLIALTLAAMTAVVGGVALDGDASACRGSLIAVAGPASCRVAFGAGALVLAAMTLAALRQVRRSRERREGDPD